MCIVQLANAQDTNSNASIAEDIQAEIVLCFPKALWHKSLKGWHREILKALNHKNMYPSIFQTLKTCIRGEFSCQSREV